MAQTMKAVRYHGNRDLRYEDVPVPEVKAGQVKIKPAFCGICGTDLHEYLVGPDLIPHDAPHKLTGEIMPTTVGHEFSGLVEEVGDGVTRFKQGDRVVVQPIIYDDTCGACQIGCINACYDLGFVGISGFGGGLAEHVVLNESFVRKIPDNIPLDVGALVEPLSVAWHAANRSDHKSGDSVLILGAGPIGLAMILVLKARGIGTVIVSEVAGVRKEHAKTLGADVVLDPTKDDVVARCKELSDGWGVNIAFDCAGVQAGLDTAVDSIRARGIVVNVAVWGDKATIVPNKFVFSEKTFCGVACFQAGDFEEVIRAISEGKIKPEKLITKKVGLHEVEKEGYRALIEEKDKQVKILVEVNPSL